VGRRRCEEREVKRVGSPDQIANSGKKKRKGEYVPVFPLVLGQARTIEGYDHIPRYGRYGRTCLLEKEGTVNGESGRDMQERRNEGWE
jgi:hypothetical protein